jgi:hypothetical protein
MLNLLLLFLFVVLAFFDSSLRNHFWPFTHVLREIWPGLTGKVWEIVAAFPRLRRAREALKR